MLHLPGTHNPPTCIHPNRRALTACNPLHNCLRGEARGFKLTALLRLPDIKAADRKTSLLRYVVERGLASRPSLATLPTQLAQVKAAASIQVGAGSGVTGGAKEGEGLGICAR